MLQRVNSHWQRERASERCANVLGVLIEWIRFVGRGEWPTGESEWNGGKNQGVNGPRTKTALKFQGVNDNLNSTFQTPRPHAIVTSSYKTRTHKVNTHWEQKKITKTLPLNGYMMERGACNWKREVRRNIGWLNKWCCVYFPLSSLWSSL